MNKLIVTTLSLLALAAPADAADVADDSKAVAALVRNAVDKALSVLKNKKLSREDKRKKVAEIIDPLVDSPLIAKLSLGPKHWPKLNPRQRESFTKLFVETLRWSYFDKIDLFSDETVEFEEPVANNKKFYVLTYILSKGERTKVAYKLYPTKGVWKAYDLEIEDVSIVRSYRSQYREFLQEGSFEQLLAKMREKITAARKKESKPEKKPEKTAKKEKRS